MPFQRKKLNKERGIFCSQVQRVLLSHVSCDLVEYDICHSCTVLDPDEYQIELSMYEISSTSYHSSCVFLHFTV